MADTPAPHAGEKMVCGTSRSVASSRNTMFSYLPEATSRSAHGSSTASSSGRSALTTLSLTYLGGLSSGMARSFAMIPTAEGLLARPCGAFKRRGAAPL